LDDKKDSTDSKAATFLVPEPYPPVNSHRPCHLLGVDEVPSPTSSASGGTEGAAAVSGLDPDIMAVGGIPTALKI
jgi:hypothetical protein